MANQDKKKQKEEFRVIEEETTSDEEVVRLDAPKPVKKMKLAGQGVMSGVASVSREMEVPEERSFDPENEWLEQENEEKGQSVPMGWFVLLGLVLLGVCGWVFLQSKFSVDAERQTRVVEKGEGPLGKEGELAATEDAGAHYTETEEVLKGFLAAETIDEMVKYVRHPARVRPLMDAFYEKNKLEPMEFMSIDEYRIVPLNNFPFIAMAVKVKDQEDQPILIEDGEHGQVVDWESFVCYQEVLPDDFLASRSIEPVLLRAYVTPNHFYSHEFDDEERYASYRLHFRHTDSTMNAYVERGTELERKFMKVFPNQNSQRKQHPLIVKARFLEGSKASKSVLIEELVSVKWAFGENPDKVASQEESQ